MAEETRFLPLGPGDPDGVDVGITTPPPAAHPTPSILTQAETILAGDSPAHAKGGVILDGGQIGVGASVKTGTKGGWSAAGVWQWTKQQGHKAAAMIGWTGQR